MSTSFGLHAALPLYLHASLSVQLVVIVALSTFLVTALHLSRPDGLHDAESQVASLPCLSVLALVPFFRRRFDFFNWAFAITRQPMFRFKLLNNSVYIVSGEENRKAFFSHRSLDLTEGFALLSGAIPMVPGITSALQAQRVALIHKRLALVQRESYLKHLIPLLLVDIQQFLVKRYSASGTADPFESIYELVFQTTLRALTCEEIADDEHTATRLRILYAKLDENTTPLTVVAPWIPSPSMIRKLLATREIYWIIKRVIRSRREGGIAHHDTLQILLDHEDDDMLIVGFIMGLIVAGARATGTAASWLHVYMGQDPIWQEKVKLEVDDLLQKYAFVDTKDGRHDISEQLSSVPLHAWENDMPVMDMLIRETLRVAQPHTAMRKNTGGEFWLGDRKIPAGAYLMYPFSDVHLDPELYPDPWSFAPGRPQPEAPMSYVAWGAGKTICQGQRLAKMELKLIISMLVQTLRWRTTDASGNVLPEAPRPDWNDTVSCRPPEKSVYTSYNRR
ncbi:cytochrome P450 [Pterulicium gracile]|uniref:Cytochrome P450 n=1 Tax=Pterulicium gracile TaxID=1884261 RepID=A0A5C3QV55_9AGAR|nr:cytochrome P450 [Pterula gracilis]